MPAVRIAQCRTCLQPKDRYVTVCDECRAKLPDRSRHEVKRVTKRADGAPPAGGHDERVRRLCAAYDLAEIDQAAGISPRPLVEYLRDESFDQLVESLHLGFRESVA